MRMATVVALLVLGGCVSLEPAEEPVAAESPAEEADEPESSPAGPVTVSGSDGSTEPFTLPSGRVTVDIATEGDCHFGLNLRTVDDRLAENLPAVDGGSSVSGELYGLDGGEYFVEAFTGPPESCAWEATFTPVG